MSRLQNVNLSFPIILLFCNTAAHKGYNYHHRLGDSVLCNKIILPQMLLREMCILCDNQIHKFVVGESEKMSCGWNNGQRACLLGWVVLGVGKRWLGEADTSMMDERPVDEEPLRTGERKLCCLCFCATDSLETMQGPALFSKHEVSIRLSNWHLSSLRTVVHMPITYVHVGPHCYVYFPHTPCKETVGHFLYTQETIPLSRSENVIMGFVAYYLVQLDPQ